MNFYLNVTINLQFSQFAIWWLFRLWMSPTLYQNALGFCLFQKVLLEFSDLSIYHALNMAMISSGLCVDLYLDYIWTESMELCFPGISNGSICSQVIQHHKRSACSETNLLCSKLTNASSDYKFQSSTLLFPWNYAIIRLQSINRFHWQFLI